ncbi:MAG: HD domain-containing protein, partial [Anaerolineales bacterium]|nr:HD domain-containing protein [Anaerolineales bacterium]
MSRLVLIVQEDSKTLETLMKIFRDRGDQVLSVTSLRDAGRAVERHKPDVIVMDVHLFGRGWQTAIPKIAERLPDTKLLYTANGVSAGDDAVKEHGKWGVLCAPFTAYKVDRALRTTQLTYPAEQKKIDPKPQKSKIRFPIRLKITFPYVILALFIAMVAAYVVTRVVFDTIEERFSNQLIETGKLASEWMVKEENRNLETLRLVSHGAGISEALQSRDAEQLRQLVYPLAVNAAVDAIEILDTEGISVLSLRHTQGGDVEDYTVSRGNEGYRHWMFVYNVLDGNADVIGDKYADVVKAPWGDYFYTAGPIFDGEQNLVGVVLVGTSLETVVRQIREATLAQVTIYNLEGVEMATTFMEQVPALTPLMASDVISRQDFDSYVRNFSVASISYGEILGPFEVRMGTDVGLIGTSLPQTFLVRASSVTRVQILVISALTFGLVILVGIVLADRITRPLLRIVRASAEIARGNMKIRVNTGGNDEVAALASSFNHMVTELEQSSDNLLLAYDLTIEGWSNALEMRDQDTQGHTQRVTELTVELARTMGLSEKELVHVRRGALLHDIGKMAIPDSILNKGGPLTDEEWVIMRKHPIYAHQMLSPIPYLRPALDIPCCHHERWDGKGYPYGLKGEEIPLVARIFAVVDVWDALTSDRSYRPAWPKQEALDHIIKNKGKHFDPQVVARFIKILGI